MAYNYPQFSYGQQNQPLTPQQMQQLQMQQYQQQMQQPVQPQIQNGGFVSVHSQKEAWDYPIAPGNSITFIDENAMKCYIKTKGFSPFEPPRFDTYKLVKEEQPKTGENSAFEPVAEREHSDIQYARKDELDALSKRIDEINKTIENLTAKKPAPKAKKEEKES